MKLTAIYIRILALCALLPAFALQSEAQAKVAHLTPAIQKQTITSNNGVSVKDKLAVKETENAEVAEGVRKMSEAPHPAKNIKPEAKRMQQLPPAIRKTNEMQPVPEGMPDVNAH